MSCCPAIGDTTAYARSRTELAENSAQPERTWNFLSVGHETVQAIGRYTYPSTLHRRPQSSQPPRQRSASSKFRQSVDHRKAFAGLSRYARSIDQFMTLKGAS